VHLEVHVVGVQPVVGLVHVAMLRMQEYDAQVTPSMVLLSNNKSHLFRLQQDI
jgi:hypothetical protein